MDIVEYLAIRFRARYGLVDGDSILRRRNNKGCSSILVMDQHRTHFMDLISTYQNRSAALETCILSIYSHRWHATFPKALLIDISESGQGRRVELGLVQAPKCNFPVVFLIS
jgi:hypothetical protein